MNYEYLEKTVVCNLLFDTLQYNRVSEDLLLRDEYISLYQIGKKLNETSNDNTITRVEVLSYIDSNWGKYNLAPRILDEIYDFIDNEQSFSAKIHFLSEGFFF